LRIVIHAARGTCSRYSRKVFALLCGAPPPGGGLPPGYPVFFLPVVFHAGRVMSYGRSEELVVRLWHTIFAYLDMSAPNGWGAVCCLPRVAHPCPEPGIPRESCQLPSVAVYRWLSQGFPVQDLSKCIDRIKVVMSSYCAFHNALSPRGAMAYTWTNGYTPLVRRRIVDRAVVFAAGLLQWLLNAGTAVVGPRSAH